MRASFSRLNFPLGRWVFLCFAGAAVWYVCLTLLLGFRPMQPFDFGLAFNSMAEHLLVGRFDVDPDAIGAEGFDSRGRTVAYFGIFCALLRVPLVLVPSLAPTDLTFWSCLIAITGAAWFQTRAVLLIWTPGSILPAALLLSLLLAGPNIQFLRPSIYQEPINWAFLQSMAFVYLAARGSLAPDGFNRRILSWMALCAGLALITRVSFGVSLYAAIGLLMVTHISRSIIVPAIILAAFAGAACVVNAGRWGNPFVFADFTQFYLSQDAEPARLGHLAAYGAFHPARIWLGLSYYFLPIWIWIRADGHVLFTETQAAMMDAVELPAGSFLLTDPLLLGLAISGVWNIRDRTRAVLLLGLAAGPVLMLCAISMAHRYRMEFYPFFLMAALFGKPRLSKGFIIGALIIGIAASHAMAIVYARSPWGPGEFYLERHGLMETYTRAPR